MSERSEPLIPGPRPPAPGPFLLAGGGTGGHVIPALAVARELRLRGHRVFFVGTERGLEAKLVPAEGFELKKIEIGGLNRVGIGQKLATLARLPFTTLGCVKLVRGTSAVFSMGGYVAGPPVMAALLTRTPVVVMEPNAIPGFTNRVIGRFVARALVSFPETANYFPKGRTETTGLPVREEFFQIAPRPRGGVLNVLITGGSQGSRTLNQAARQSWPLFRKAEFPVRIVHQTGPNGHEQLLEEFARSGIAGEVVRFITDMPAAFRAADLVVCRSGAGAVSELAAAGKPSILVPFPFAADDHQTRNAEAMERGGAARLVRDAEMNGEKLLAEVAELARSSGSLERMGEAARQFAHPGAARRAAEILEAVARGY
ncbi:UDP-N-acetylglucosamine--N-acetylmuramyl-(pentapeptide) pyrophosphoryl-undecaprenol N-acetylglucosamine transferase [Candidatus Sulfopaludibacter sp. SbA6]|nr:UDP-N-acetylglucosamine--N-acetylmuramyl-(pentapeptide) pyrophosphoryl-undecaprenol N-acetylglucosamine transferase [Candidatus Sulfopaludibacter sp. SbA6]